MFFNLAEKRPLPEAESQSQITPRVVIVHTMVGSLKGTENFFTKSTGLESHFGIGGPTDGANLDGVIFQWMDTDRRADANLDANAFAISIETSDGGDPSRPWSSKQIDALVRLINALCDHHSIPRKICDRWDGSGLGWHVMFGAPGHWTPVSKSCPGPVRIKQLKNDVFPRVLGTESIVEVDMTTDELLDALESDRGQRALASAVRQTLRAGFAGHAPGLNDSEEKRVGPSQAWLFGTIEKIRNKVQA
jgi:N-acetylmuramoyl-L-alanine amidase